MLVLDDEENMPDKRAIEAVCRVVTDGRIQSEGSSMIINPVYRSLLMQILFKNYK